MLIKKGWLLPLICSLILAVACTPTGGNVGGTIISPEDSGERSTGEGERAEDLDEPPAATLTINGREQNAGIGSYCWNSGEEVGICADMIGVPTDPNPLPAESTFLSEFHLPLEDKPDRVLLSISAVTDEEALPADAGDWRWWSIKSSDQHHLSPSRDPMIELTLQPGLYVFNLFTGWRDFGDVSYGFLVDVSGEVNPDAAAFAEQQGLSLEEANRRLKFQETIGDIQPALMADLPDSFGGLWVEHEPAYRIVIALTDGDGETIRPYIEGREWAEFVEVQPVIFTLEELKSAQSAAGQAADAANIAVTTAVDVINNRVELMVGNPDLFLEDLAEAGIELPEAVKVLPALTNEPLPATNEGVLFEATTTDGRKIYLPKQPPTGESMAALMEGTLVEMNGCLRLSDNDYPDGFLILWPYDSDFRVSEEQIEVLNGEGQVIARVGELLSAGGGAMESSRSMANFDELIPGMPIEGCPGPYWVAGQIPALD